MTAPRLTLRSLRRPTNKNLARCCFPLQQQQQLFHSSQNHEPLYSHSRDPHGFEFSRMGRLLPATRCRSDIAVTEDRIRQLSATNSFPASGQCPISSVRVVRSASKTAAAVIPKPFDSNTSLMSIKPNSGLDHKPPDERLLKLGKTLRILSSHLPMIFINPLPQEILSPNVQLHLFPSTHSHLPVVKGRMPYIAALWTAPLAWGHLPIFGHVEIEILSERMGNQSPSTYDTAAAEEERGDISGMERLVVRWQTQKKQPGEKEQNSSSSIAASPPSKTAPATTSTEDKSNPHETWTDRQKKKKNRQESQASDSSSSLSRSSASTNSNRSLSVLLGGDAPIFKLKNEENFTGMFVFRFDRDGRIASHTIEHAEDNFSASRTSKVVTLTDWLLGLKDMLNGHRGTVGSGNTPSPVMTKGCPVNRIEDL